MQSKTMKPPKWKLSKKAADHQLPHFLLLLLPRRRLRLAAEAKCPPFCPSLAFLQFQASRDLTPSLQMQRANAIDEVFVKSKAVAVFFFLSFLKCVIMSRLLQLVSYARVSLTLAICLELAATRSVVSWRRRACIDTNWRSIDLFPLSRSSVVRFVVVVVLCLSYFIFFFLCMDKTRQKDGCYPDWAVSTIRRFRALPERSLPFSARQLHSSKWLMIDQLSSSFSSFPFEL